MYSVNITKFADRDHKFIRKSEKPLKNIISEVCLILVNQYLRDVKMSVSKWRVENRTWKVSYEFPPGQKRVSKSINYLILSMHLRESEVFNPNIFDLPDLLCPWLDHSMGMKLDFYMQDQNIEFGLSSDDLQTHNFGENYPIKPTLKREGLLYTAIQPQLIQRIIRKRDELILGSDKALTDDWVFDLRNIISDSMSLIDIAFNQLYLKAEYDPLPNWKFDKSKIGDRHKTSLNDKLKWVFQITGNNLNIESEKISLESLRLLRNHLMHFDPPSLVITIEEAAIWLNQIIDIGKILIKMRRAIGVDVSYELIIFVMQREAIFVPVENGERRSIDKNAKENYRSSTW